MVADNGIREWIPTSLSIGEAKVVAAFKWVEVVKVAVVGEVKDFIILAAKITKIIIEIRFMTDVNKINFEKVSFCEIYTF